MAEHHASPNACVGHLAFRGRRGSQSRETPPKGLQMQQSLGRRIACWRISEENVLAEQEAFQEAGEKSRYIDQLQLATPSSSLLSPSPSPSVSSSSPP